MSRHFLPGCCRAVGPAGAARVPARPLRPQGPAAAARRPAAALDPGDLWRTGPGSRAGRPQGGLPGNAAAPHGREMRTGRARAREGGNEEIPGTENKEGTRVNPCSITSTSEKLQDHLVASLRMKPQPKSGWSSGDQGDVGVIEAAQDAGEVDGDVVVAEAGGDSEDGSFGGRAAELVAVQGGDGVFPVDVGVGMPVVAGAGADAAGGEVESRQFRGHFHYAAFGAQLSNWRS